jgi:hypothetical protein
MLSPSIESLWNTSMLSIWCDAAHLARAIMVGVSVLAAAHYLAGQGFPLSTARLILLGV